MSEKFVEERLYSRGFGEAISWALEKHAKHLRKGTLIPYASHLLAVTSLVLDSGGTETEATAAVLHDVVEDIEGVSIDAVRDNFGAEVAAIVAACTDAEVTPKPPWKERKLDYINHLKDAPESALIVSMADKYHNVNAILADYREIGDELWGRFNGGREGTLWYYEELEKVITARASGRLERLAKAFSLTVDALLHEAAA